MASNYEKFFTEIASQTGLRYNSGANCLYGNKGGFTVSVSPVNNFICQIVYSVTRSGQVPVRDEFKAFVKQTRSVTGANVKGVRVTFVAKASGWGWKKTVQLVVDALNETASHLARGGYRNVCQKCGKEVETGSYAIGSEIQLLCPDCYDAANSQIAYEAKREEEKTENIPAGIVGALLGSLVGVAAIVVLDLLGYVAVVGGIVMGICAAKGYEMLGKKFSGISAFLCIVITVLMTYFANHLNYAIFVARELNADFFKAFQVIPAMLENGILEKSNYYGNLALLELFTLVGSIPTIISAAKERKKKLTTGRIG